LHTKQLKNQEGAHAEPTDVKSEIKAFIGHHVLDSHDFTFLSDEVEENIMVFVTDNFVDNGIHLFSSSRFNHGEAVAESNGNFYVINHHDGKIYKQMHLEP
jgi:F-type H+-transporting ATPase subunit a